MYGHEFKKHSQHQGVLALFPGAQMADYERPAQVLQFTPRCTQIRPICTFTGYNRWLRLLPNVLAFQASGLRRTIWRIAVVCGDVLNQRSLIGQFFSSDFRYSIRF